MSVEPEAVQATLVAALDASVAPAQLSSKKKTEAPGRVIMRYRSALGHGNIEERQEAIDKFSEVAASGRVACDQLIMEMSVQFTRTLSEESDEHVLLGTLLALERMAAHQPSEVCENGVALPLIALLDSASAAVRAGAARLTAVLCEDEHGLASARLLDVGLVPAMARLGAAEREASRHDVALMAVSVLARVSQESRFARVVVDGSVHGVLLAFASPQFPDAPESAKAAQLQALRAIYDLGKTSEFKAALSAEGSFFPLLFSLRDSDLDAVIALAHRIASHWGDDFFGWAWECCSVCKQVGARSPQISPKSHDRF